MTAAYWILVVVGFVVVGAGGFLIGRSTSQGAVRARELERELARARDELSEVREGISGHFETSARMFGQLAHDYRAFYEHFADTARLLGIPERRANELLQQADPGRREHGGQRAVADSSGAPGRDEPEAAEGTADTRSGADGDDRVADDASGGAGHPGADADAEATEPRREDGGARRAD